MSRIGRGQRKLRQARLLLVAVRQENPELADQVVEAIDAVLRAEDRSAEIIRAGTGIHRR